MNSELLRSLNHNEAFRIDAHRPGDFALSRFAVYFGCAKAASGIPKTQSIFAGDHFAKIVCAQIARSDSANNMLLQNRRWRNAENSIYFLFAASVTDHFANNAVNPHGKVDFASVRHSWDRTSSV